MSQTTCQLIGANTVTDSNLASSIYATTNQVKGVTTTGSITTGTAALTVTSGSGINNGDSVVGEGIAPGTTVLSGGGTTSLTLSANAAVTLTSKPVSFFTSIDLLTPGNTAGQLCKAWVNFNGTGTVAIRASYNVSSITDNGIGNYTVNFTTAMPDANYSYATQAGNGAGNLYVAGGPVAAPTSSAFQFGTGFGSFTDLAYVSCAIFR
ncbi:hypothetical protein EBT25_00485 [bacterium]|nr:hypothetical protein [bacterium]